MLVYVESNFVLELALWQEQSDAAKLILQRAESGQLQLAFPAFSLSEPYHTLIRRERDRKALIRSINEQMGQLSRSSAHRSAATNVGPAMLSLAGVHRTEMNELERVL